MTPAVLIASQYVHTHHHLLLPLMSTVDAQAAVTVRRAALDVTEADREPGDQLWHDCGRHMGSQLHVPPTGRQDWQAEHHQKQGARHCHP